MIWVQVEISQTLDWTRAIPGDAGAHAKPKNGITAGAEATPKLHARMRTEHVDYNHVNLNRHRVFIVNS